MKYKDLLAIFLESGLQRHKRVQASDDILNKDKEDAAYRFGQRQGKRTAINQQAPTQGVVPSGIASVKSNIPSSEAILSQFGLQQTDKTGYSPYTKTEDQGLTGNDNTDDASASGFLRGHMSQQPKKKGK